MQSSDIRDAFKLAERPDIISFAGGFPDPQSFPAAAAFEAAAQLAAEGGPSALQYGPTEGLYEMRAAVAERMREHGAEVDPEQVLITSGSQQGLDLAARVFLDPGDRLAVEQPAYIGAVSAFRHSGAELIGIPVDDDGLRIDLLEEALRKARAEGRPVKALYVVPDFQNPTGVTLSADRRRRLAELAEQHGFVIIEDAPYAALRFEGTAPPPVYSFDRSGRTIYLGSYSKIFMPGFRLGWVAADRAVIAKMAIAKQGMDLCSNSFGQRLIAECERRGLVSAHVERLRGIYREKRDRMLAALNEQFPSEFSWTYPNGGFFVWLTLPEGLDAKLLLAEAVAEEKVAYVSGQAFYVDGSGRNTVRLAYSQSDLEQIDEGVRRLARFFCRRLAALPAPQHA